MICQLVAELFRFNKFNKANEFQKEKPIRDYLVELS